MSCNHVTRLAGLNCATGFWSQFMMAKLIHLFFQNNLNWSSVNPYLIHQMNANLFERYREYVRVQ
jgi:hypothetical protein